MNINFSEIVNLIQAIVWPIVVLALLIIFRREIPKLVQAIGGKISRLSAAGVTLEFAAAELAAETLSVLDEIREPTSTGPPPPSGVPSLLELSKRSAPADYLVIDLRDGHAWLTSRLYLFAFVLAPLLELRCFVFVGTRGPVPRYFLGLASPESVARTLERRSPWLRKTMVEMQLKSFEWWRPYGDTEAAVKRLVQPPDKLVWEVPQAEALSEIVRDLIDPFELSMPGQVEQFVSRFLHNPNLRRPHAATPPDEDWVPLGKIDEHARWIKDERDLLDLLVNDLHREQVVESSTGDNDSLQKAVLQKRGDFVAVTDSEGRLIRLIDRRALLEAVATGKHK